jgi:hypothetical protein
MEEKQLAVVEQLPLIRQYFEEIHREIAEKTTRAIELVVTEDNVKDIKKIRAELNKEYQDYEEKRKEIKRQILAPYEAFEKDYKEMVALSFQAADSSLKKKIDASENLIKDEKELELKEYFEELAEALQLSQFVKFEQLNIKINMSDSMKKLMAQVDSKMKSIQNDIMLINLEPYKGDILVEYLIDFNFARAKMLVLKRKEMATRFQQEQERVETVMQEEKQRVEALEKEIIVPKITEELLTTSFKVQGTREQLIALREYINESGLTLLKD